jgi:hypothetical protein
VRWEERVLLFKKTRNDRVELSHCDGLALLALEVGDNFVLVYQGCEQMNCLLWTKVMAIFLVLVEIDLG